MARTFPGHYIPGFMRTVVTSRGKETYQVLLEETNGRWIARIATLPNVLWVEPGAREAVKFFGATAEEAEGAAAAFIEAERLATGRRVWMPKKPGNAGPELRALSVTPAAKAAERIARRLLLRFGVPRPELPGVTANLSESGLFIITDRPGPIGATIAIDLRFPDLPLMLGGEIVWVRSERRPGVSVGCGVRLVRRPTEYLDRVRGLLHRSGKP